jgi:hypothetical protein
MRPSELQWSIDQLHYYMQKQAIETVSLKWAGHLMCIGAIRNAYEIVVRKHEGERRLQRHKRRSENYDEMDITEMVCEGACNYVAQWQTSVNQVINLWLP